MDSFESDDEDLKRAIAMSLASLPGKEYSNPTTATNNNTATSEVKGVIDLTESPPPKIAPSFLGGLDRKAMEAERLARLSRKRERSISPPPLGSRKVQKVEESTVSLPSGAVLKSFSTVVNQDQVKRKSEIANAANQRLKVAAPPTSIKQEPSSSFHVKEEKLSLLGSLKYPNGVVKKTWVFGFPRTGNDIKLEEVLEPQTLRTAVLSAFQWDVEWVLAKLRTPQNGGSTKCVFIMQGETEELRQQMQQETESARGWLRLCFPPMYQPIHCMHSKLMLLFHADKLRIAIPTANLLNFDWGETGVKENSVFMIDLPRRPRAGKASGDKLTSFANELLYFLRRQKVDQDIRDGLLNFDFSATKNMMFVHTVGGSHYNEYNEEADRTGLPGLARAVRELGQESLDNLQIDFAASSIGSLNDEQLKIIHAAARGEDMLARAEEQRGKTAAPKSKAEFFKPSATKPANESLGIRDKIRIYFPTQTTVKASIAQSTGTVCLNRKWFESEKFPRTCFRDYRSTRKGLLSHNKILYARGKQIDADTKKVKDVAWFYIGSANMSESAWGKLSYDKTRKAWKIVCRNWECGVILPVPAETLQGISTAGSAVKMEKVEGEDSETESEDESNGTEAHRSKLVGMDVFNHVAELPFEFPGPRYGGQEPWYFMERQM